MRVAIIGGGPVGLVSGTVLASVGHDVCIVDIDTSRVGAISNGAPPFHEPGLEPLLRRVVDQGRLRATNNLDQAVSGADITLICVGTPSTADGADLTALCAASAAVGHALRACAGYRVVAVKSTVPPGTTSHVVEPIVRRESGLDATALGMAMNPEFLREGLAVADMQQPDRIVVGMSCERVKPLFEALYAPFDVPMCWVTPTEAEMAKYASNALLASLISFSNEIASLCESIEGADAIRVLQAVHADRRFRSPPSNPNAPASITSYLLPGLGYGGSCFPKDTTALSAWARARDIATPVLDAVRAVNATRPEQVLELLRTRLSLKGAHVAVLGLAFKPDTDDLRESRSVDLARLLHSAGAVVRACDPFAAREATTLLEGTAVVSVSVEDALRGADAAIVATAWTDYITLDPARVAELMRRPLILDARRALDPARWSAHCEYLPIGARA